MYKDLHSLIETLVFEFLPRNTREYFYTIGKSSSDHRSPITFDPATSWLLDRPGIMQRLMNYAKLAGMRQGKNYQVYKLTQRDLCGLGLADVKGRGYILETPLGEHYTL